MRSALLKYVHTGQKFGLLSVGEQGPRAGRAITWHCVCDCGNTTVVRGTDLRSGNSRSCGCFKPARHIDEIGRKFHSWSVLSRAADTIKSDGSREAAWLCLCDCGTERVVRGADLRAGTSKGCGCSRRTGVGSRSSVFGSRKYAVSDSSRRNLLHTYQRTALRRQLVWSLADETFFRLTQQNCHYCDAAPKKSMQSGLSSDPYVYNGIDRIDSKRGYEADNVLACCRPCNYSKGKMPYADFVAWLDRVAVFRYYRRADAAE